MAVQVLPRENKSPWLPLPLLLKFRSYVPPTRDWNPAAQISIPEQFGTSEAPLGFSVVPMNLYVVSIHLTWIPVSPSKDPQLPPESCCPASFPATVLKVETSPGAVSAGGGACSLAYDLSSNSRCHMSNSHKWPSMIKLKTSSVRHKRLEFCLF